MGKPNKGVNLSLILSLLSLSLVLIFSVESASRISSIENRYNSLLTNTMNLVDNLAKVLTSLESDKVIRELIGKVNTLRKESESLKSQLKNNEKELANIAQKEKKCQDQLGRVSGRQKKEEIKDASAQGADQGNKGFLIKDGKPNK